MTADLGARIVKLMREVDYQINTPDVATMGLCTSCPGPARGAATCVLCLTKELAYIVGSKFATEYILAQQNARNLRRELLRRAIDNHGNHE